MKHKTLQVYSLIQLWIDVLYPVVHYIKTHTVVTAQPPPEYCYIAGIDTLGGTDHITLHYLRANASLLIVPRLHSIIILKINRQLVKLRNLCCAQFSLK